jgi:type VII secretion protein EccB
VQTRRDHLQAYQFAMGRLATALVSGDPGRGESPTKRAALGTFLGAGIVVLLCVGFGVYGLISPPPTSSWRTPGSIVVEQRTGSRFLYLGGELRPVRNYASALLLAGKGAVVRTVSDASLGDTPHGAPIGIADAPDELPTAAALVGTSWTRCLRADLPSGEAVDFAPSGATAPFPTGRQLLINGPDSRRYLLWRGVSYRVPSTATLIALGLDGEQAVPAPQSWIDSLPAGAPLAAAPVPQSGKAAGSVAGRAVRVGQLFTTTDGTTRSYVMTAGGIAPVSATEAALLAARPGTSPVRQVSATDLAAAPVAAPGTSPGSELPDVLGAPALAPGGSAVCLEQHIAGGGRTVATALVVEGGAAATGGRAVLVPANGGVLAVDQEDVLAQVSNPREYLITDQGTAYPLGDNQTAGLLGLGSATPLELPESLLAALPHGPVLGRAAAAATLGGGN